MLQLNICLSHLLGLIDWPFARRNDHNWPGGSCDHDIYLKTTLFDDLIGDFKVLEEIILDPALLESFKFCLTFRRFLSSSCILFSPSESNNYY